LVKTAGAWAQAADESSPSRNANAIIRTADFNNRANGAILLNSKANFQCLKQSANHGKRGSRLVFNASP
jgi:hypothetical protein